MEKNSIKGEIIELLEIVLEQSEIICQRKGQIPQIEIDIVLSNIRKLYEKYINLERLNKQEGRTGKIAEIKPATEIKKEEAVIEEKMTSETEKLQKKIKSPKETSPDLFSVHPTIADKFKDEKKSLNETLSDSGKSDKSLAAKMQKNPIKDMKASIGINEKFKLINHLFEGNLQKYNEGVSKLNECGNFEEAKKHINLLKTEYNWEETDEAYIELYELVVRRYQA